MGTKNGDSGYTKAWTLDQNATGQEDGATIDGQVGVHQNITQKTGTIGKADCGEESARGVGPDGFQQEEERCGNS